jgi:hypothetical protein
VWGREVREVRGVLVGVSWGWMNSCKAGSRKTRLCSARRGSVWRGGKGTNFGANNSKEYS